MKNLFALFVQLLFYSMLSAQLPNAGFEEWQTIDNLELPVGWETNQDNEYQRIDKSTDAADGDFALHFLASEVASAFQNCSGVAAVTIENPFPGAESQQLRFQIKTQSRNTEGTCYFDLFVNTKKNGFWSESAKWSTRDEIATYVEVPLSWNETNYDSLRIIIAGGAGNGADDGCYDHSDSWVDAFSLEILSGQQELQDTSVTIYPNPANQEANIRLGDAHLVKVRFFNAFGEIVLNSDQDRLDLSNLKGGFYLVRVETDRGVFVRKLVVK